MDCPVIVLAFANERGQQQGYLRNLPAEMNAIRAMLQKAQGNGLCELVFLPYATLDSIIDTFQNETYRHRIAVLHYGGHAGSYELLLESDGHGNEVVHGSGLVPFLGSQEGLQFVFLNGCHSAHQAAQLLEEGIPAVIGTVNAIEDQVATTLAISFYKGLGEGMPLEKAWAEATYKIKAKLGTKDLGHYYHQIDQQKGTRDFVLHDHISDQFPWEFKTRPGAEEVLNWNLPEVSKNPYFGLPKLPPQIILPITPYRFLERYQAADARIFFGRGTYIRDLYHRIHNIQGASLLLFYGQSGVGKSSLLEAGLFPRLQSEYEIKVYRRNPEIGLLGHFLDALGLQGPVDGSACLDRWIKLEQSTYQKGLLIVLDQVEEVFTRPSEQKGNELQGFLKLVRTVFMPGPERPKGKLILSYRKEYDPEIKRACSKLQILNEQVYLEKMDRQGIMEIVGGLASSKHLKNQYRLDVEEELKGVIADDLLEDKKSSIAPVLQIILTKLWQLEDGKDHRHFSIEQYQNLRKEGILLDDFFHQQMAKIAAWEQEIGHLAASSGLALDVLNGHTTELGTATSQSLEAIRQKYQHQTEVLEKLMIQFQDLYLLAGIGNHQTILAHDTLAPIVQKEIRDSDKPGQRALRILHAKMADYELYPSRTFIDATDLQVVENGAAGMRLWTEKEAALIKQSQELREKRARQDRLNTQLKTGGSAIIAMLAVVLFVLWQQSENQAKIAALNAEALAIEPDDPNAALSLSTEAAQLARTSWFPVNDNLQAINDKIRYKNYDANEFYADSQEMGQPIKALDFQQQKEWLAIVAGQSVLILDANQEQIASLDHQKPVRDVHFVQSTNLVYTIVDQAILKWTIGETGAEKINTDLNDFKKITTTADGQKILLGNGSGQITLLNEQGKTLLSPWQAHQEAITGMAFFPNGSQFVTVGWDGQALLWDTMGQILDTFMHTKTRLLDVAISNQGQFVATAGRDSFARIWRADGSLVSRKIWHSERINQITFVSYYGSTAILTGSNDHQIKLWKPDGTLLRTYKGHRDYVNALVASANGGYFFSGGEDQRLKKWFFNSKARETISFESGVAAVQYLPDQSGFFVGIGSGIQGLIDRSNDLFQGGALSRMELFIEIDERGSRPTPLISFGASGEPLDTIKGFNGPIRFLKLSKDQQQLMVATARGGITVLDVHTMEQTEEMVLADVPLLVFDANDQLDLVAYAKDQTHEVLLQEMGTTEPVPLGNAVKGSALLFSTDDQFLWVGHNDTITKWDMAKKSIVELIPELHGAIQMMAQSNDQKTLVVGIKGESSAEVRLINQQGVVQPAIQIGGDTKTGAWGISALSFSPDQQQILIGTLDGRIEVIDRNGNRLLGFYDRKGSSVNSVQFSPDQQWILAGNEDGRVRQYPNILNLDKTR